MHRTVASTSLAVAKILAIVSDGLITTYCDPDQGTVIKNITQNVESYTHTYNKVGEYKATFIATRVNYKHDSRMMKELTIKVVE